MVFIEFINQKFIFLYKQEPLWSHWIDRSLIFNS